MRNRIVLTLSLIFIVVVFSNVFAQPIPEYEGVYLLTQSNKLIELPQVNGIRATKSMARNFMLSNNALSYGRKRSSNNWGEYDPQIVENLDDFFYTSKYELNDIPVVSLNKIKGFYVNSRNGKYSRFNSMAVLKDYTAGYGIFYKFKDGTNPNSIEDIAYGNSSYSSNKFRAKNISEFVTYYEIKEKNNPYKTGSTISDEDNVISCVGFYIELTAGNAWFIKSYQYPFYIK